jgi:predicted nucleotidyltransferase
VSQPKPVALDVERLLRLLDAHGVLYILIGGLAARLHGSPDLTEDIDITPERSRENLTRLAGALKKIHARCRGAEDVEWPIDARGLATADVFTLTTDLGMLDLCFRPAGVQTYEQLLANADTFDVFGVKVAVASLDDIIASKTAAARNKDLRALPTLRRLQERLER